MKAGFAEVDITPPELGKLGRLIAAPTQVTGVHSPLFARLAVFDDGACRAAILSLDMNWMFTENIPEIRAAIAAAGDLEPANIMVACSHSHNSFPTTPWHEDDDFDYAELDYLLGFLPGLTQAAVEGLRECSVAAASTQVPGLTQNRRCCYRGEDGSVSVATHGPHDVENFIGVEGPIDDELKVLLCRAADGEVLGGMANVAAHPTSMFGKPVYSSSYIGPLVEGLKARYGGIFGFLYGVSGDLCLAGNAHGPEATARVGELLAAKAIDALSSATQTADDTVRVAREIIPMPLRRVSREQVKAAKHYQRMNPEDVDERELCRKLYGHDFIFYNRSVRNVGVFINETIGMWEFQRRCGQRELTRDLEVQVIRIGEFAVVGFASELFNEVKHALQAASPFKHTFFATMANGGSGYLPPPASHANGGYETCVGVSSQFVEDASDRFQQSASRLLQDLAP